MLDVALSEAFCPHTYEVRSNCQALIENQPTCHEPRFHVDDMSSAHVYLRLPEGAKLEDIPPEALEDCAQLVKHNSIQGAHTLVRQHVTLCQSACLFSFLGSLALDCVVVLIMTGLRPGLRTASAM